MPELPPLPAAVERELAIRLVQLLEGKSLALGRFALTPDYIAKFEQKLTQLESETNLPEYYASRRKHHLEQLPQSVCLLAAKQRFRQIESKYWSIWCYPAKTHEEYGDWLSEIIQRVLREIASVWVGRSEQLDQWWIRCCRPDLENALQVAARPRFEQARSVEIARLGEADRGNPLLAEIKSGGNLSPAAEEALRRAAVLIQNFSQPATNEHTTEGDPDIPGTVDDYQAAQVVPGVALKKKKESVIGTDIDFSTSASRNLAVEQCKQILKYKKAIKEMARVDRGDFNKWERGGHGALAKGGFSEKARRIEDAIRAVLTARQKTQAQL